MKKLMVVVLAAVMVFSVMAALPVQAKDTGAATVLSLVMPGAGEWYNGDSKEGFPWGECIVGNLCFCFKFSSAIDAANGATDSAMRYDFWTAAK